MEDKDKSIMDLMEAMKRDVDEFYDSGKQFAERLPYSEDPAYEEERRINRTLDTRTLTDGRIKNTLTGEVTPAPDYEHMSDVPPDLPKSNRGF